MSELILTGLKKTFEKGTPNAKLALDDLSLKTAPGDFITVLGSNGAGKSTLFNAILGKFRLDRGKKHAGRRGHHQAQGLPARAEHRLPVPGPHARHCPANDH